jgi:hypothetical protein
LKINKANYWPHQNAKRRLDFENKSIKGVIWALIDVIDCIFTWYYFPSVKLNHMEGMHMEKNNVREAFKAGLVAGDEVADQFNKKLERAYPLVFKGGIVLVGLSISMVSFLLSNYTERDLAAARDRFSVEAKFKKPIADIDCKSDQSLTAECNFAVYESRMVAGVMRSVITVAGWTWVGGVALVGLGGAGFLMTLRKPKKQRIRK